MIGPPGLPKYPRRVFAFTGRAGSGRRGSRMWRWALGLYVAGVVAHFSHTLTIDLAAGRRPSFSEALATDVVSLVWPAELIGVLMRVG